MKIAIFGAGGVGGYFGAKLAASGADVAFVARGAHLAAMRADGLKVESALGNLRVHPVRAVDDPAALGPVDAVLMTVKLYDLEAAAEAARPLVGPKTVIVGFQNGVEAADVLAARFGKDAVAGGIVYIMAEIAKPGTIGHMGTMAKMILGPLPDTRRDNLTGLIDVCRKAGFDFEESADVRIGIWSKLAVLAPLSGMTTLTRLTIGPLRDNAETRALLKAAAAEVAAVARARGVPLPSDAADAALAKLDTFPAQMGSSMLHDIQRGARLELKWLSGAVARLGQAAGVATPVHAFIASALAPYADGTPKG